MAPLDPIARRNLRVEVRLDPLVEEALRYITLPWPRHEPEGALNDLGSNRNRFVPIVILEQMVLDGVTRREDVADFLAATLRLAAVRRPPKTQALGGGVTPGGKE